MDPRKPGRPSSDVPSRTDGKEDPLGAPALGLYFQDPRSSSTQSLVPSVNELDQTQTEKRKLLLIYIHGFMGSDTSFQSFPVHVHRYLKSALSETHVIHSKLYPRYKTYKAIELARDNFSKWLRPHESSTTDVVLLGHSMGGLLAAEVVLKPTWDSQDPRFFQHRILGCIHLDAPLLGLHPGIVASGISSLFRPKPETREPQHNGTTYAPAGVATPNPSDRSSISLTPPTSPPPLPAPALQPAMTLDPNYNPVFANDIRLKDRGWWKNVAHFVKKHNSEGLVDAFTNHIMSHLEFGSCLLDYKCLKLRYESMRKLEDVDDVKYHGFPHVPPRVRFAQYYTICYGYPKKTSLQQSPEKSQVTSQNSSSMSLTPAISLGGYSDQQKQGSEISEQIPPALAASGDGDVESVKEMIYTQRPDTGSTLDGSSEARYQADEPSNPDENMMNLIPTTITPGDADSGLQPQAHDASEITPDVGVAPNTKQESLNLPPIPPLPERPKSPDLDEYIDKDARKQAEKEAKRIQKAYDQAVKNREKALKERQKLVEKHQKKLAAIAEKQEKQAQKQRHKEEVAATAMVKALVEEQVSLSQAAAEVASPTAGDKDKENSSQLPTLSQQSSSITQTTSQSSLATSPLPTPNLDGQHDFLQPSPSASSISKSPQPSQSSKQPKKKKERKFINTPAKIDGEIDPKWIKVFMKDMDEVGAHTGLFCPGPHYEKLVGDVGDLIVQWVHDDMTKRTILAMGEEDGGVRHDSGDIYEGVVEG